MQNRYFGDVGDFGKYGLLRVLGGFDGEQSLKLGVVWYLFPDEGHNADGKHVGYLQKNDATFRNCDQQLYDKLRELLYDDLGLIEANRHTGFAETSNLLPNGTIFYSEPLSYLDGMSSAARSSLRNEWFAKALAITADADFVFLDPDNGIECASVKRTSSKGPKYAFWTDIDAFVERGQSMVIYHHLNRTGTHLQQVEDKLRQMKDRYGNAFECSALTFTRGSNRAYFIVATPRHKDLLRERISRMRSSEWNRHFRHQEIISAAD
jgi:hypothetical protein